MTSDHGPQPPSTPARDPSTTGEQLLFNHLALAFGLLAVATASAGLLMARSGIIITAGSGNKTIALSAALIWIFLGSVIAYRSSRPLPRIAGLAVQVVLVLIAVFAAIEFFFSILGSHFFVETAFVTAGTMIIGPASSPISPAAAALAVPAALALVLAIRSKAPGAKQGRVPDAVSLPGWFITLVSFTLLLSYAYGNPLLYGTQYIPIAFFSALAAFFTGAALIATAGPYALPLAFLLGNTTRARLLRVFVPLVIAIALVQNIVFVELSSLFDVRDAVLLSGILVVFVFATAFVVARVSGGIGSALEKAEQELVRKNQDLGASNEELTATQEELRQTNDELIAHEHKLTATNVELAALNEELTASDEELRQNIDELVRAEKALRESQKENTFLADLLNHSEQPFGVGYPDGRLGIVNPAFERLTGYSAEELRTMDWATVLTPAEWREPEQQKLEELTRTGIPVRYEKEYLRKDGTRVPIELLVHIVKDARGNPLHYYSFITDITGRKLAEEALQRKNDQLNALNEELTATEEELHRNFDELSRKEAVLKETTGQRQLALDAARMGWWRYDPVTRISSYDSRYREIFSVMGEQSPNDEILATRMHPDDLPGVWAKVERALDPVDPQPYSATYRINLPDGTIKWIEAHGVATFSGTGKDRHATSLVGTVADITGRKRVEDALRESEERFRLALRNAPVSVAVQDRDLVYRWAYNQTTRRTDEIVGKTDADLFAQEDVAWLTPLKRAMLETGEDVHTGNWLTSNGKRVYLDLYLEPLRNPAGEITGIGIAAVNQTGLKHAEDALIRTNEDLNALNEEITATQEELHQNVEELTRREQDLGRALAEKEVLLSEIHHRVKNNLTAFISLLSLEGSTEETPAGRLLKQDLQNRARSMALVHETLYRTNMYDEVDMGIYLTTLVDQVAHSFQTTRPVRLVVDAHGVMLDIPRATPAGLIINELITNSFKYAFPESFDPVEVRNAPPTITIALSKSGGLYELVFRDNGIGLPEGFDIATTQTLGLKLVNFLARHQLRAKVEVTRNEGTEFAIRFRNKND